MPTKREKISARSANTGGHGKKLVRSCTINKPREELFSFWRRLENLPRFSRHVVSITEITPTESHWVVKAPGGTTVEWDAVIINEHPNELLAWETAADSSINRAGTIRFEPAPAGQGTEVTVQLDYEPPAGKLGVAVAKLTGEEPELQLEDDLHRFKALMETGEIPTTEGQPAGGKQTQKRRRS